ncbi:MAG: hypothetical protein IJ371_05685 [Clostridia bacterium]|nr:hypothetical protein [Clostridia bacterium]
MGNINKVFFDKSKKKIKCFEILNDEEISYCLEPKFIYTIGKHAITIKNKQHLVLSLNENNNTLLPIDAKVYSLQGEYLGIVKDYSLTDKYQIENLILDNQQIININDMASCSTNSVVVYYSQEHVNIKAFRYRIQNKSTQNSKVKVLPKLFSSFNKIATNPTQQKENFIIGRICTKDIFDNQQNIIIKQNSTITDQTLALASSKNKLQELMKYSKEK